MSPVLILSRLCLKRRFQFLGISEMSSARTARTFLTASSSMIRRRPARPAFSHGTMSVLSGMVSSLVGRGAPAGGVLGLQVAIDEVDLLQPAQALADLFCSDLTHA